jgi:hypothetical protein
MAECFYQILVSGRTPFKPLASIRTGAPSRLRLSDPPQCRLSDQNSAPVPHQPAELSAESGKAGRPGTPLA